MHVDLTFSDLDRTYGLGQKKASSNKARALITKFVSYNTIKIFFFKKKTIQRNLS